MKANLTKLLLSGITVLLIASSVVVGAGTARAAVITFGLPAIPPVFLDLQAMVAAKAGFFKKYGADVKLRNFPTGSNAARALIGGDVGLALSPTPLVVNEIANTGANVVAIYGMEHPDYYLVSTNPKATCKSVAGHAVGVDAPGGALSVALKLMLAKCGVPIEKVQQIGLSANVPTAMIAGQLKYAVLHLDGVIVVQDRTGKKLNIITNFSKARPIYHDMVVIVRRDKLASNKEQYVRIIAAMIAASRYMHDPAHFSEVARIAAPTGLTEKQATAALKEALKIKFWPLSTSGLDKAGIEAVVAEQKDAGNILPSKQPPSYSRLVDLSIFDAALTMANEKPSRGTP